MLPHIIIGQIKISTYYGAMILGYILMLVVMSLKYRRQKYGLNQFDSLAFATIQLICGVLGCKILFIIENLAWVKNNGITLGGFSFYGAVFLSPFIMPLIGKLFNLKLFESLDCSAICIISMLGTIRIGCFLNGCCGGIVFNIEEFYFTFPTQLIECIFDFSLLYFLISCEKRGIYSGTFYSKFLILYGCARFIIEFLRNTDKDWIYLSHAQWFSIAAIIIGMLFETVMRKQIKSRDKKDSNYAEI